MMWLRPYRFATAAQPVRGATTLLAVDDGAVSWGTKTFAGTHTSSTGNLLLVCGTRSNTGSATDIAGATWNGHALTETLTASLTGVGRAIVWAGLINGTDTGARDLAITAAGANVRDFIGWLIDFDRAITIGAAPPPTVTNTVKSSESINITPADANSLLLGFCMALDENINPMSVNSGWTEIDNQKTGVGGGSDLAAIIGSRTAATLTAKTFTGVSDALSTTDDWAALALELLPA